MQTLQVESLPEFGLSVGPAKEIAKWLGGAAEVLPAQYTEEQFFGAGRFLAKIEHGMQWVIGDWYNAIPWGNKEEACKKAGLDYKHASNCGAVAEIFKFPLRNGILSFDHHRRLAVEGLDDEQRTSLLRRAEWGEEGKDGTRKPWSTARLVQERDKILGRERIPLPDFDVKVDRAMDQLPANTWG